MNAETAFRDAQHLDWHERFKLAIALLRSVSDDESYPKLFDAEVLRIETEAHEQASRDSELSIRLAQLPKACLPLVRQLGPPDVFLPERQTVLVWDLGFASELDTDGVLLHRINGDGDQEQDWQGGVAEVQEMIDELARNGYSPSSVIVSSCAADTNPAIRFDVLRAKAAMSRNDLRWIAVPDPKQLSSKATVAELIDATQENDIHFWFECSPEAGAVITLADAQAPESEERIRESLIRGR